MTSEYHRCKLTVHGPLYAQCETIPLPSLIRAQDVRTVAERGAYRQLEFVHGDAWDVTDEVVSLREKFQKCGYELIHVDRGNIAPYLFAQLYAVMASAPAAT